MQHHEDRGDPSIVVLVSSAASHGPVAVIVLVCRGRNEWESRSV